MLLQFCAQSWDHTSPVRCLGGRKNVGNLPGLRELSRGAGNHQEALHCLAFLPNPGFLLVLWSSGHSGKECLCSLS